MHGGALGSRHAVERNGLAGVAARPDGLAEKDFGEHRHERRQGDRLRRQHSRRRRRKQREAARQIELGKLLRDQRAEAVADYDRLLAERVDDPPRVLDIVGDGEAGGLRGADAEPATARASDAPPALPRQEPHPGLECRMVDKGTVNEKKRGTGAVAFGNDCRKSR